MMKRIEPHSIKSRILIGFFIMFILVVIVFSYYYINLLSSRKEQSQLLFDQVSGSLTNQMDERLNTIEQVAKSTGYYSIIQKVLFSNSANEKVEALKAARELLATNRASYPFIVDIFLYADAHTRLYSNTTYAEKFRKSLEFNGLVTDVNIKAPLFSNIDNKSISSSLFFYYLPISNIIYDGTLISQKQDALCVFLCDMSDLYQIPDDIDKDAVALALVQNNRIISTNREYDEAFSMKLLSLSSDINRFTYEGRKYYANVAQSQDDLQIICVIPVDAIKLSSSNENNMLYLLIILVTFIVIAFLFITIETISSSVNSILRDLDRLQLSSDNSRLHEPRLKEFLILARHINKMLDRLEASVQEQKQAREKLYKASLLQQKTEMVAYRSQINPHFLFNTMECIRSMAQFYKNDLIEQIVSAMAKMFRYSLYAKSIVPLSQEIDHIKQYMTVINIRYPDFFTLKLRISEQADSCLMPSMLMQPLVENSVKHAFHQSTESKGSHPNPMQKKQHIIQIKAWIDDAALLHIQITDNGRGMTDDELAALKIQNHSPEENHKQSKDSIGVQNIYRRIKLLNSGNKITFSSKYGYYTKVHLILNPVTEDQFDVT